MNFDSKTDKGYVVQFSEVSTLWGQTFYFSFVVWLHEAET